MNDCSNKTIFISYSVKDREKVKRIKRDVQAAGYNVWIYPEAIDIGEDIVKSEKEAITNSDFILLMWSRHSNRSKAVQQEIRMVKQIEKNTGKKKLLIGKIDESLPLKNIEAIQICELSDKDKYASQLYKLLDKIDKHRNYEIYESEVVRDKDQNDNDFRLWYKVTLKIKGASLNHIAQVDYHLHPFIARDSYTVFKSDKRKSGFSVSFYTPDNEVVYAVITFVNGEKEELRHVLNFSKSIN